MEDVRSRLKGTTLRVYWHFLRSGKPTTIRGLQRDLDFSSPSVASYHLEKLMDMGLVVKTGGDYELKKTVSLEVISSFVRISHLMIPRYMFYTTFFFTLLGSLLVTMPSSFSPKGFESSCLTMVFLNYYALVVPGKAGL